MKNFIFKSPQDFHKIVFNKLDMLLSEQRHQRSDLATLLRLVTKLEHVIVLDKDLQKQVDDYFEEDEKETSPQTEQVTNLDTDRSSD